jgi:tetratricopeptide (TPR) repeat protein
MMCGARLLEVQGRREAFLDLLEAAICRYPDDVELWIWRGKAHGTGPECIPFQIAAHVLAPEHPSPNHELVHAYEGIDRPALGWPYTIGFRQSAPNMPHAHHMQAHLAMRLGRWQEAIDATRMSRKKSLEGFPELDPSHHIDILIRALAHEGRFREAESEPRAYRQGLPWARLLLLKAVPQEIEAWTETRLKSGSPDGNYIAAVHRLEIGDLAGTKPHLDRIEEQFRKSPGNIYRNHEVKGRYLVEMGRVEEGLRLLREAAARAVKDPGLHAWGGGSYVLEAWGRAALRAQRWEEAVEAFHEALAHEHGSIIGALGMQVVAERRGDAALAAHYADRARRIWKDADPGALERNLAHLRRLAGAGPEGLHKP